MTLSSAEQHIQWQEANNDFLKAALNWLRLKLRQRIQEVRPAPETRRRFELFGSTVIVPHHITDRDIENARHGMAEAAKIDPPPSLYLLSRNFGLSDYEQNILLLCAAVELDPNISVLCSELPGRQPYPTFALARLVFDDPAWDALSPERSLRYFRLIEINQPGAQPLTSSPLRADERIVSYLKGLNYLDDRLAPLMLPLDPEALDEGNTSPSQRYAAETVRLYADQSLQANLGLTLVQLAGPDGLCKQMIAAQAARELQPPVHLLRLPVDWLPAQPADLENLARLWERERILLRLGLYLDARESRETSTPEGQAPPLQRFLGRIRGIALLDTREVRVELGQSILAVDIARPTPDEQAQVWVEVLGPENQGWPERLAGQFSFNLPTIRQITALAEAEKQAEMEIGAPGSAQASLGAYAWKICLTRTRPQLDQLAQHIEAKADWDDLELPPETKLLLEEICGQVEQRLRVYDQWGLRDAMNRGLGISALFAGESGTGKTMAAEVIAKRLNLNLYRIDLSAVVSKYIGETEKNLRRLFDAAEGGGAILFFDEADALFGKRSEVKDSHDRYANIEVNYLLQRMEGFQGLAILATNMKSALDQAFTRRLRFIVHFTFPGVEWRKRIWVGAFPPGVPLDQLDYDRLSRFNLTGGSIHNAAVNAAFLAASHPGPVVTMETVLLSIHGELRKMEKPILEKDFELILTPTERGAVWMKAISDNAPWKKGLNQPLPAYAFKQIDIARLARLDLGPSGIYDVAATSVLHGPAEIHTADVLANACSLLKALGKPVREEDCRA